MSGNVTEVQLAKYDALLENLRGLGSVAVAFSAGVDSAFLLHAAREALGDRAIAVTARSRAFPQRELEEARLFCEDRGIRRFVVDVNEMEIEGFSRNPVNRCYLCKRELFGRIIDFAAGQGVAAVVEGSNVDDEGDYRPGMVALAELGVKSPLRECGLTKADIRALSRRFGLPTWDKPSYACLATRFPYGQEITPRLLDMVGRAEQLLIDLGFRQVRVRFHGALARVELPEADFGRFMSRDVRQAVVERFREIGFNYAALDLQGYRTGSMNETIPAGEKEQ